MANRLLKAMDELIEEEQAKKKKKRSAINISKEKRLQYYSGWHKDDRPVTNESGERQEKLC